MSRGLTIADVCSELVDCVNRTAPETPGGGFFAVGTPAMRGNKVNLLQARQISLETFTRWTRRLVPEEGDLLLAREAPVGPVVRVPSGGKIAAGQRTMHLRVNPAVVHPRYLFYLLTSPAMQAQLLTLSMGSTVPHLRVADVKSFTLPPLPPLSCQESIQCVLGALDDKIAANESARNASRALARSIFVRALPLGDKVMIRDVVQFMARGITPRYRESAGTIVLNQKCVRDQQVSLIPSRLTEESSVRSEKLLQPDDVLVNSTGAGTLGRVARWTRDLRATVDSHITIVRFDSRLIDPVCAGFSLLRIEKEIEGLAEGSTGQTELRRDLLAGLKIGVPDKRQQGAVGAELSALDKLSLALHQESDRLAATRDELLPLLMSGKIRVREAEKIVEGVV